MSKETEGKIIEAIEQAEEVFEPLDVLLDEFGEHAGAEFLLRGQPTQASLLVQLAAHFELFHTPDGTAYADIYVDGHRETYPINGDSFEQLFKHSFYKLTSEPAAPEAVRKARDILEARAKYEGPTREVRVRVAGLDEALYVDLGDKDWSVVKITPGGWSIIQNPPVRFCRFPGMLPLPVPEREGSIDLLSGRIVRIVCIVRSRI